MSGHRRGRLSVVELSGRGAPRAGILDNKPHIRLFLAEVFEELGFVPREYRDATELLQDAAGGPSLVVVGLSTLSERELTEALRALAEAAFPGKVMLFGGRNSSALMEAHELGSELGLLMLEPLKTPFSHRELCENLAVFLPVRGVPTVPVDAVEALGRGWFELLYRVKINPRSMRVNGIKALPHLKHPGWGTVPLNRVVFDDDARKERALYKFVLTRAIRDWLYFAENRLPVEISIGLPVRFLADAGFLDLLAEQLPAREDFPGLVVEIDDPEALHSGAFPDDFARTLRRNRVAFSLDSASAETLDRTVVSRFPFREIRVDSSFVKNCARDRERRGACERIRGMAEKWGALAGAAGVDSYADYEVMRDLDFDRIEGRLVAEPMPASKFVRRAFAGRPPA